VAVVQRRVSALDAERRCLPHWSSAITGRTLVQWPAAREKYEVQEILAPSRSRSVVIATPAAAASIGGCPPRRPPRDTVHRMKFGILACAVVAAFAVGCSKGSSDGAGSAGQGASGSNEDAGEAAARTWLAAVDAGSYAQSWTDAAALFKKAVDQATWQKQLDAVRAPLGKVVSRKVSSRKYAKTVPGAPDGDYVIVTFDTVFEKKASAVETVTPMKDPDGTWRVSGYFIK